MGTRLIDINTGQWREGRRQGGRGHGGQSTRVLHFCLSLSPPMCGNCGPLFFCYSDKPRVTNTSVGHRYEEGEVCTVQMISEATRINTVYLT